MRIVITGGSSFIGTNLIEYYERNYKEITLHNIDIKKPINNKQDKYWVNLDILDCSQLNSFIHASSPEIVIHLAARTDLNGKNSGDYLVNTLGTQNLIDSIKMTDSIKKIIFASTMLVCYAGYVPKHDNDYSPTTIYGQSKAHMEDIIKGSNLGKIWTIVRPTSIWGPWFAAPYRSFFEMVLKGLFFHPGDRACTKTYGYVGNLVYQIDQILTTEPGNINKKVFYLGDEPAINISSWADQISIRANNKKNIKLPYAVFVLLSKIGDVLSKFNFTFPMTSFRLKNMTTNNIIDLDHLYNVVGECPFDLDEATRLTLKWMKKNKGE